MDIIAKRLVPWVLYPLGMTLAIGLHLQLLHAGFDLQISTYLPVFLIAGLITLAEYYLPYHSDWRPDISDLKTDIAYMILVQTLLPKILGFAISLQLLRTIQSHAPEYFSLWPHELPLLIQVVMMILLADFLRYWLHVAAHNNRTLWRLHAVHHSSKKLYWINTGRFHPLEKMLQFLLDAFPFILLGVNEQVLALYFVFYAANGFFQHCNIQLKFGLLNYFISTAELHRWHHSRISAESNSNYGNNTIVWDLVFGSWYLPHKREVDVIGLISPAYPQTLLQQLTAPFIGGLDKKNLPLVNIKDLIINLLIYFRLQLVRYSSWRTMIRSLENPKAVQQNILLDIVQANTNTRFGELHRFGEIATADDYTDRVPVQSYESLVGYFIAQDETGEMQATSEPAVFYSVTSGTTGPAKYIPITQSAIGTYRLHQLLFSYAQYRNHAEAFTGKMLGIVGQAVEGQTKFGTPYGAISGLLYESMPAILKSKYVLPKEVFSIHDYQLKYRTILRIALGYKDITYIASANPSTFILLSNLLEKHADELIRDIDNGTFFEIDALDENARSAIKNYIRPNSKRADELKELQLTHEKLLIANIWPHLQLVVTWTGGSCANALGLVKKMLPAQTRVVELGYLSSEFRGTITLDEDPPLGIPTIEHNYFEFVERQAWESNNQEFLTIDQLTKDKEYYVIVTTKSGLYRYFMNDIVRVSGTIANTPTLNFVQKGKGVTNITGEKLSESQIMQAVQRSIHLYSIECVQFIALANRDLCVYELYIELDDSSIVTEHEFQEKIENALFELNIEYRDKRMSSRLHALQVVYLQPGTMEQYKAYCLQNGQREGQFKIMTLQYKDEIAFSFEPFRQ